MIVKDNDDKLEYSVTSTNSIENTLLNDVSQGPILRKSIHEKGSRRY